MNIPTLPTDNLYKFAAISGSIILILAFYVPIKYLNDLDAKIDHINTSSNMLEAERTNRLNRLKRINRIIDNTKHHNNSKLTIYYNNTELKKMYSEQERLGDEITIKESELNSYHDASRNTVDRLHRYKNYVIFISTFGVCCASLGYIFWYLRVQKYQDINLKYNAYNSYSDYSNNMKLRNKQVYVRRVHASKPIKRK